MSAGWARLKRAGELGERVDGERRERGDLERPGAQLGDLADGAARVLEREERLARGPDQRAPRVGQREAAPDAVEELCAELAFERAQRLRERGLGDVQPRRRRRERAVLDDRQEVAQAPLIDHRNPIDSIDNSSLTY